MLLALPWRISTCSRPQVWAISGTNNYSERPGWFSWFRSSGLMRICHEPHVKHTQQHSQNCIWDFGCWRRWSTVGWRSPPLSGACHGITLENRQEPDGNQTPNLQYGTPLLFQGMMDGQTTLPAGWGCIPTPENTQWAWGEDQHGHQRHGARPFPPLPKINLRES